jgi:hypothetical protein
MPLADLTSCCQEQDWRGDLSPIPLDGQRKAILSEAGSGRFSSNRNADAADIWKVEPCPNP